MSCGEGLPKDDGDEKEGASRRRLEEGRGYFLKCTLTTGSVTATQAHVCFPFWPEPYLSLFNTVAF